MGRILALDVGAARIGLALSDPLQIFAQPLPTLSWQGRRATLLALQEMLLRHEITKLVVGLPLNLEGGLGRSALRATLFARTLRNRFHLPVVCWDERMTTQEARKRLGIPHGGRSGKGVPDLDQAAAMLILESYLDSEQRKGRRSATDPTLSEE